MNDLDTLVQAAQAEFDAAPTPAELENAKARYLGKAGRVTELLKGAGTRCRPKRRRRAAPRSTQTKQRIEAALRRARRWPRPNSKAQLKAEALGRHAARPPARRRWPAPGEPHDRAHRGHLRLDGLRRGRRPRDRDRLDELHGAEQPGEPSGALDAGHLLRRHEGQPKAAGSTCARTRARCRCATRGRTRQVRRRSDPMPEIRVIAPGRTYRVDSDATHSPMFHQCRRPVDGRERELQGPEGDVPRVHEGLLRDRSSCRLRFRPSYFPFTEPSAEIDVALRQRPAGRPLAGSGRVGPGASERGAQLRPRPERYIGFAFGWASTAWPCCATASTTCACSSRTTCASCRSSSKLSR